MFDLNKTHGIGNVWIELEDRMFMIFKMIILCLK